MNSFEDVRRSASSLEDAALVSSYLSGESRAFERIYEKHGPSLMAVATMSGATRADASDIVHDVFTIAMERLHQIERPTSLYSWLLRILRRQLYRNSRTKRERVLFHSPEATIADIPAPNDPCDEAATVIAEEIAYMFRTSLAGLEIRDRDLFASVVRQQVLGPSPRSMHQSSTGAGADSTTRMMTSRMRERLLASSSAFLIAKHGRQSCRVLRHLLRNWNGEYGPSIRRRVSRHVATCPDCCDTRRRLSVGPIRTPDGPR